MIQEGNAEVSRDGEKIAELGPGDVFGEAGVLEKSTRVASVTATTPMRLITLDHWALDRLRRRIPETIERIGTRRPPSAPPKTQGAERNRRADPLHCPASYFQYRRIPAAHSGWERGTHWVANSAARGRIAA